MQLLTTKNIFRFFQFALVFWLIFTLYAIYSFNTSTQIDTYLAFDALVLLSFEPTFYSRDTHTFETSCLAVYSLIHLGHYKDSIVIITNFDSNKHNLSFSDFCQQQIGFKLTPSHYERIHLIKKAIPKNLNTRGQQIKWIKNLKRAIFDDVDIANVIKTKYDRIMIMDSDIIAIDDFYGLFEDNLDKFRKNAFDIGMFDDCSVVQSNVISKLMHENADENYAKYAHDIGLYFGKKDCNKYNVGMMIVNTQSIKLKKCFNEWTNLYNKLHTFEEQNAFDLLIFDHFEQSNECLDLDIVELDAADIRYTGVGFIHCLQYYLTDAWKLTFIHLSRGFRYGDGYCKEMMLGSIKSNIRQIAET